MAQLIISNKSGKILSRRQIPDGTLPKYADKDPDAWSSVGKYRHKPICTPGPRPKKIYATTIV